MKPMLKAPGFERLKLSCDELPSNFALKFIVRRYNEVAGEKDARRGHIHRKE
jgi:hypothetical protein